ncbi:hypothetical protein J3F83DRAFT_647061 [Trichoderma novae-zelandiae]
MRSVNRSKRTLSQSGPRRPQLEACAPRHLGGFPTRVRSKEPRTMATWLEDICPNHSSLSAETSHLAKCVAVSHTGKVSNIQPTLANHWQDSQVARVTSYASWPILIAAPMMLKRGRTQGPIASGGPLAVLDRPRLMRHLVVFRGVRINCTAWQEASGERWKLLGRRKRGIASCCSGELELAIIGVSTRYRSGQRYTTQRRCEMKAYSAEPPRMHEA